MPRSQGVALSLFWRTFFLLAILLGSGIVAWVWTLRALEFEPRAVVASQQIASLVNLARAALHHSDAINRVALVKTLSAQEAIRIAPHEPTDKWEAFEEDRFTRVVATELRNRLGSETIVAKSVNGQAGLWVGFGIERDAWWLQTELGRVRALTGGTWFVWVGIALLATIFGSVAIARLINQPLRELSFAASRIREGEFDSRLDENTMTSEIREVNMGFNRMARELAKVEEDRAVMLAGISHDLRTPLSRIRLGVELLQQVGHHRGVGGCDPHFDPRRVVVGASDVEGQNLVRGLVFDDLVEDRREESRVDEMSLGLDRVAGSHRSILQGETVVHASDFSVLSSCSGSVPGSGSGRLALGGERTGGS
mgnify:CR=1 FL=1